MIFQFKQGLMGFLTVLILLVRQGATATPSINVALQASFPAPPYLLELLYVLKFAFQTPLLPANSLQRNSCRGEFDVLLSSTRPDRRRPICGLQQR